MAEPFPLAPSLWFATAPAAASTPPLAQDVSADACVIGAGFAGLSTALHLAEAGVSVVVLESHDAMAGRSSPASNMIRAKSSPSSAPSRARP